MKPAKSLRVTTLAFLLIFARNGPAYADLWELLNPKLRETRQSRIRSLREIESLGEMKIGNSCEQIGAQFHMLEVTPTTPPFVQIDFGYARVLDTIVVVPAVTDFSAQSDRSYAFPAAFRVDVSDDQDFSSFAPIASIDETKVESEHGLPIVIRCNARARYLRLTVQRLARVADRWTYALGELMVLDGNRNIAIGAPITGDLPELDGAYSSPDDPDDEKWMMVDLGKSMPLQEIRLHPIHARQGNSLPGYSFPRRFRVHLFREPDLSDGVVVFDSADVPFENPGSNPVSLLCPDVSARFVRVSCVESSDLDPERMGLAEISVYSSGRNVATNGLATMNGRTGDRGPELLIDGYGSYGRLIDLPEWVERWDRLRISRSQLADADSRIEYEESTAKQRGIWAASLTLLLMASSIGVVGVLRRRGERLGRDRFRRRLAQDLHDEIGSNLAAIARLGELAELESRDDQSRQDWKSARQLALECADSMRETLWLLGGTENGGDFCARLHSTATRMLPHVELDWHQPDQPPQFANQSDVSRQVFLMFKEVIANIAKHSSADRVDVRIESAPSFRLTVRDNGVGMACDSVSGMGLRSIRERSSKLGGQFSLESELNEGTTIVIEAPI
ncbi:MAG: ATP-binding protein [Planctomycetota bacterium]